MTEAKRSALVVASYEFEDAKLRQLRAPARDAEELARVLGDESIGDFDVDLSLNEPEHVVRRKLAAFFQNRGLDDVLLLHLSCHGLKDDDGHLYFATADTEVDHLDATSIPSEFVNRQMTRSRSRRIVLLLDCCYSGAFASGMLSRAGDRVDIKERFDGRGRVVLTASSAMEYSFEGDELSGAANPSVFTSALVKGLESGGADRNRDGWISVEELYDYAYDEVRAVTPSQTPGKWTFDVQGELYLARSLLPPIAKEVELPAELRSASESPFAHVRLGAVQELIGLLHGADEDLGEAARSKLEELVQDDSRRVSEAATDALAGPAEIAQPEPAPAVQTTRVAEPKPSPPAPAVPASAPSVAETGTLMPALAFLGAVGFFLTYVVSIDGSDPVLGSDWIGDGDHWLRLAPFEWVGAWLGALLVAFWSIRGRLEAGLAAGALFGLGGLGLAAAVALAGYHGVHAGAVAMFIGAVVLVGAGVIGLRASARQGAQRRTIGPSFMLALAGAVVSLWALSLYFKPGTSLISYDDDGVLLEVIVAALLVAAAVASLWRGRWEATAAALLVTVGTLTLLHFAGVVVAVPGYWNESLAAGGFVGAFGAALVLTAGVSTLAGAHERRSPKVTRARPRLRSESRASVWLTAVLALVGAAALLFTSQMDVFEGKKLSQYAVEIPDRDAPLLFPPLEFIPVALAVTGVALALLLGRIRAALAAGLLIAFGFLSVAAVLSLRSFFDEVGAAFVPVGALAILPAGLLCAWRISDSDAAAGHVDRVALGLGAVGAALCFAAIFPLIAGFGTANVLYVVEVYAAVAAVSVGVLALVALSKPVFVAGILLGLGFQSALHFIESIRAFSGTADLTLSGVLGMLGATLVAVAGLLVLRAERARLPRPSPA